MDKNNRRIPSLLLIVIAFVLWFFIGTRESMTCDEQHCTIYSQKVFFSSSKNIVTEFDENEIRAFDVIGHYRDTSDTRRHVYYNPVVILKDGRQITIHVIQSDNIQGAMIRSFDELKNKNFGNNH